jgi:hypothetical protein
MTAYGSFRDSGREGISVPDARRDPAAALRRYFGNDVFGVLWGQDKQFRLWRLHGATLPRPS